MTRTRTSLLAACLLALGLLSPACDGDSTGPENPYDLSIDFTGFDEHVGQRFELRVIDVSLGNAETGRVIEAAIPSAAFTVLVRDCLTLRDTFHVDFTADHDRDTRYDPPPTDHSWRVVLTAPTDDTGLVFAHSNVFTDVGF